MCLEMEMVNIKGKKPRLSKQKWPEAPAELHDCCNCEGCICEDWCKELEEKYFGKEGDV